MNIEHFELVQHAVAKSIRSSLWRLALLGMAFSSACQSSNPGQLDGAINSYESKNWRQSLEQASAAQKETSGTVRDQAAFLAGLSAYQLGNDQEALSRFQFSEQSMDDETAGESKVMLGHVMVRQKKYKEAANYYDAAADKLSGAAKASARELAAAARDPSRTGSLLSMVGPAMSINGNPLSTQNPSHTPSMAQANQDNEGDSAAPTSGFEIDSNPPPVPKPASKSVAKSDSKSQSKSDSKSGTQSSSKSATKTADKPAKASAEKTASKRAANKEQSGGFVIQAGSFILETSAKNRAKELSKAAAKNGMQAPKVAPSKSKSGQRIWIVYVGEFQTRADAEKAIKKLGRKDLAVVEKPG